MGNDTMARSWFCVANNPQEHGYIGTPEEIAERIADDWVKDNPQRSCAIAYCISADGLHHLHKVLEDVKNMRFSAVKKVFPSMHMEPTKVQRSKPRIISTSVASLLKKVNRYYISLAVVRLKVHKVNGAIWR